MTNRAWLQPDIAAILRVLRDSDVRFVVVGGAAAAAHGLSVEPGDVDIRSECDADNLLRLSTAMQTLRAVPASTRHRSRQYGHLRSAIWKRKHVISSARREGYTWPHIAVAVCGWAIGRTRRTVLRRPDPLAVFGPQLAHDPHTASPEELGLGHSMTVVTKYGLLSCYLCEPSEFEVFATDARPISVGGVTVDVASLDYVLFVNRTFGRFKDRLRSRQLRRLHAEQAARDR
jgi:hypothetical protein